MSKRKLLVASSALALFLSGCSSKPTQPVAETTKPAEAPVPAAPVAEEPQLETKGTHVVVGEVTKVHPKGSSITIRHTGGNSTEVEVNEETNVRSLKHGATAVGKGTVEILKVTGEKIKDGTMATVHFFEKGGKKIGTEVQHGAKVTAKTTMGVVHKVEHGGKKVIVKTIDGTEHTFEVAKHVTAKSGDKITEFGKLSGEKIKEGATATFHFTEEAGHKIMHVFDHKN